MTRVAEAESRHHFFNIVKMICALRKVRRVLCCNFVVLSKRNFLSEKEN